MKFLKNLKQYFHSSDFFLSFSSSLFVGYVASVVFHFLFEFNFLKVVDLSSSVFLSLFSLFSLVCIIENKLSEKRVIKYTDFLKKSVKKGNIESASADVTIKKSFDQKETTYSFYDSRKGHFLEIVYSNFEKEVIKKSASYNFEHYCPENVENLVDEIVEMIEEKNMDEKIYERIRKR